MSQSVFSPCGIVIKQVDKRKTKQNGGQSHDSLNLETWGARNNDVSVGDEGGDRLLSGVLKKMALAGACSSGARSTGVLGLRLFLFLLLAFPRVPRPPFPQTDFNNKKLA